MKLEIFQVDAFTSMPFSGNPAAVVPLEEWLPEEVMLSIAAENNLAETAFYVHENGKYHIRWFTPSVEVNLCGHATLATAHVIFNELKLESDEIEFYSDRSGGLSVSKEGDRLVLDFPVYAITEIEPIAGVAEAGQEPLKYWVTSSNKLMMRLKDQNAVATFRPPLQRYLELPYETVMITAKGDDCDFASRMFAPKIGISEDPVTGAMHCALIPYWAEQLGKTTLFARQVSKRGGELHCELRGDRVRIGGNAVLYMKGEIYVDANEPRVANA